MMGLNEACVAAGLCEAAKVVDPTILEQLSNAVAEYALPVLGTVAAFGLLGAGAYQLMKNSEQAADAVGADNERPRRSNANYERGAFKNMCNR